MSDIEYPELYGMLKNTVGFYYTYATDPERIQPYGEDNKIIYFDDEDDGDLQVIEIITAAVYTHLIEGGYINVGTE